MVTAYGDNERRRVAEEYGAAQVLTKPVDFDLLKAQLRNCPTQQIEGRETSTERLLSGFRVPLGRVGNGARLCENPDAEPDQETFGMI